ncbi:T9SS type A sorting domain-containing protein [Bacteroidota bacterium]
MKKILLLSFIFLLSLNIFSQVWIGQGAKWTFDYWNLGIWGTITFDYTKDTLIQGYSCQKVESAKYSFWHDQFGNTHSANNKLNNHYTYSSGDSVFYLINNEFFLMYDFSATVGDTWIIAIDTNVSACEDTAIVKVSHIDTVLINNQTLRTITLETITNSYRMLNGKCIEKFGISGGNLARSYGPFTGYRDCPGGPNVEWDNLYFRCYEDATFPTYNPWNIPCDTLTTAIKEHNNSEFNIYPNPANNELIIKYVDYNPIQIHIYNVAGILIKEIELNNSKNKIEISDLKIGIYFIQIISDNGITTKKFVKN